MEIREEVNYHLSFGRAIEFLKQGHKVARKDWNGAWIVLMSGLSLPSYNFQGEGARVNDRTAKYIGKDTSLDSQPYIAMWTSTGHWQPGWLACQADMLSEDWEIV